MRLAIFEEQFNSHQRTNAIILRRLCAIPKDVDATDKFHFLHSQKKSIWIEHDNQFTTYTVVEG